MEQARAWFKIIFNSTSGYVSWTLIGFLWPVGAIRKINVKAWIAQFGKIYRLGRIYRL